MKTLGYLGSIVCAITLAVFLALHFGESRFPHRISAQTANAQLITAVNSSQAGIAPYAAAVLHATSLSATNQAVTSLSTYFQSRSQWGITATSASRLASADFNARQSGSASITPNQLATAVNAVIAQKLSQLSLAQQQTLAQSMSSEMTPKGLFSLGGFNASYASFSQGSDGRLQVTVNPSAFSQVKSLYQQISPSMVSSSSNFYPSESQVMTYVVLSCDVGYDATTLARLKKKIGDVTGLDMSSRSLYGDHGYACRRPLSMFFDQSGVDLLYSNLNF